MYYSAPSHPLIYSFLLQKEEFQTAKKIIVENRAQGEKLLKHLEAFQEMCNAQWPVLRSNNKWEWITTKDGIMYNCGRLWKEYRLIATPWDILEVDYDENLVGVFPIETLEWQLSSAERDRYCFELTQWGSLNEETLITWLTEHGYNAKQSDEEYTFFRRGDTVSIQTRKGVLLVNFFGSKLETLYLGSDKISVFCLFSVV